MFTNIGHTIQKLVNSTPVAVTINDTTTSVVTTGGNVYQTGLINNHVQQTFHEIFANTNAAGHVIDAKAVRDRLYLLNATGSVFEYVYTTGKCDPNTCGPIVHEVYSPTVCGGDKAVKIDNGRAHLVILTENHKVWGVGDNSQYQLVPQGQCRYDVATELIVIDTILHDNTSCHIFSGVINELEKPIIPCFPNPNCCIPRECRKTEVQSCCGKVSCVRREVKGHVTCVDDDVMGSHLETNQNFTVDISDINYITTAQVNGILSIPVLLDYSLVGFLCVDDKNFAAGTITYCICKIYIPSGTFVVKIGTTYITVTICSDIILFDNEDSPISNSVCVKGCCGTEAHISVDLSSVLSSITVLANNSSIILQTSAMPPVTIGTITPCTGSLEPGGTDSALTLTAVLDVSLECCGPQNCCTSSAPALPQPNWTNVYAGCDITVLVDNCNRLYVLGSLHRIRNNKDMLKRSCLDELLKNTDAHINFPADQLNCCVRPRNETCKCVKCRDRCFKTDLSKFGISINFPQDECCETSLCDFLKKLKQCNEEPTCNNTCTPCDSFIYLNVCGRCGCPDDTVPSPSIGRITLYNKKSVCKLISQGVPDLVTVIVSVGSTVEFDLNKYCIDGESVCLDKIVLLDFGVDGPNVDLYLDTDRPGGVQFTANSDKCNVEFSIDACNICHRFLLNYGDVLDPVELTNLKCAFALDPSFPCPRFKNPFDTKITNTYVSGGDHIKFIINCRQPDTDNRRDSCQSCDPRLRQSITPDLPTVFRLQRRIIDVAVGANNLSVLVGGLACPNEVFALGANCHGELGIHNYETTVCWKHLNRCLFDCQVVSLFSGPFVTFYVTQSQRVYSTGQWKCIADSNIPKCVPSVMQSWKINRIDITKSHIVMLGADGCLFGLGENDLGQLGLCHFDCVKKPTPLVFFTRLNQCFAKKLCNDLKHPVNRGYGDGGGFGNGGFGNGGFGNGNGGFGNGNGGFGPNGGRGNFGRGNFGNRGDGCGGDNDCGGDTDCGNDNDCGRGNFGGRGNGRGVGPNNGGFGPNNGGFGPDNGFDGGCGSNGGCGPRNRGGARCGGGKFPGRFPGQRFNPNNRLGSRVGNNFNNEY